MLLKMICAAQSKPIDTTCVPTEKLRAVLSDAKQKPVLLERISLLSEDMRLLNQRIAVKDSIILVLDSRDRNNDGIIRAYEDEKKTYKDQVALIQNQMHTLESMLRKEKRKRFWTGVGGTLTTGLALFLLFQK